MVDYPHPKQAGPKIPKIPLCLTQESSYRQSMYSLVCGLSISKEKKVLRQLAAVTCTAYSDCAKKLTTPAGQPASVI